MKIEDFVFIFEELQKEQFKMENEIESRKSQKLCNKSIDFQLMSLLCRISI